MYGSVPFSKDEHFTPLRAPKTPPTQSTLSVTAAEFYPPNYQQQYPNVQQQQQQFHQQPNQQQLYQHQFQHQHQNQQQQHPHSHQHQRPNQRLNNSQNGYQNRNAHFQHHQHHAHHHQHQQNYNHQQQQQTYQQEHNQRMSAITNDVQDGLKISNHLGNNRSSSSHNYNSQGHHHHHHHNNHHHHHHRSNNSYQQSQQSRLKYNNYPSTSSASKEKSGKDYTSNNTSNVETVALDYLSSVLQCLNSNPGQYDSVATHFLNIFEGLENNQFVLSIAMEDIFNESTRNPNFRYMGAKLYHLLHMLNLKKDSLFLTLLKCKLDDFQQEVLEYMKEAQHGKVREATLFLAELYMQLRGDDSRILLLAENIVFSLRQLLESESSDNVRCICLTLKLAGYDLTNDCPQEIAEIISALQSINERSPGKYPIIASVLTLSKENWGRKLSSSASFSESEGLPEPPRSSDEPIFYGPDGRELTTEETDFLTGELVSAPCGGSTDDDDDVDLDELDLEMDEEASKAYMEFCKQNTTS